MRLIRISLHCNGGGDERRCSGSDISSLELSDIGHDLHLLAVWQLLAHHRSHDFRLCSIHFD